MVRKLSLLVLSSILAVTLIGLALLAIQNVTPVSVQFLMFRSIQFPVGFLLVVCVALGLLMGSILGLLPSGGKRKKVVSRPLDDDFDFDDL